MPTPLPIDLQSSTEAETQWERFLKSREALTKSMHLEVCDGCDGCGGRCTTGFTVTLEEWEAVRAYLQEMPAEERERVRTQNKVVPWPGAEDTGATVNLCQFRDTERNNCSIYPARPTICRLFGQTGWLPCPINAVPEYPDAAPRFWDAYRRFERRTFEEWNKTLPRI